MSSEKIQILAIDDKNDNLISLKAIIMDVFPDAEVITTLSGKKGITLAGDHDPDVILLDIVMPEMDGYEVCRKLKSDPKLADIPVVFITALKDDSETRIKALDAGAEAFLSKPIDVAELTAQIRAMLKIKAANIMKRDEKGYLEFILNSRTKALEKELAKKKKAEDNLRIAHERLLTILDGINAIVYVADIETHELLFINQFGQKDFKALEKQKCWKILQEDKTGPCEFCTNDKLFDAEGNPAGVYRWEFQNTKNGRWYDCQDSAIKWIDGRTVRLEVATDITERKNAEDKIKENERFLDSIFESIQDGLSILDSNLNVRHVNKVMKEWYAPNLPLEGKKCFEVYHNRDKACEACPTIACMKSGKTESAVFPGLPEAKNEWVEVFSYPVKDASTGEITGVVEFVRDVTERVKSENITKASRELAILQRSTIAQLVTEDSFVNGDIPGVLKIITKMLSELIDVERASVWQLSEDSSELLCLDLYEASKQSHSKGEVLKTKVFPSYFEAIKSESRIYADDAQNDPRSVELTKSYLKPLNISSLLDAGITIGGSLIGVVSCEHIGDSRKWRPDEESFISTIAAIVSQLFENNRRRQAEQNLKESEETYRNIFQNAQVGLFRTRISDGKMIESNKQLAKMCGYDSREEFINEYFTSQNYVDEGVREKMLAELKDKGSVQNFEARFYRKDRSMFWVNFSARIFPEKGWLEGVVEDITWRKQAEEMIRESESKYRLLVENMNDGLMQVDNNDKIVFVNQRICDMFGYDVQDLVGQISYKTLIFQDDWNIILEKNVNRIKRITEHYEVRGIKKTGEVFWIHVSAAPVVDQQGNVGGSVGILRDISERKKTEEALRENEQRFRTVLENMPILLNAFDEDGSIIAWNKACEEVTGYKASEVIGNPGAMSWLYPDPEYRELVWKSSEDPHIAQKDFNLLTKNGEIRIISWFDTYHYVDIPGWASWGIGIDITERRRAEENLLKTKQLLEQTSKMSKVGGWEKNLLNGEDNWSEVTKEIHEVEPDFVPDMKNAIEFYKEGESRNRITEVVKKLIETGESYDVEVQLITAKGNERWIRTIGMGDFKNGVCHRIFGTFQDITEKKNAEQALKDAAENWNRTFRSMRDGVALLDADQKIIQCNQAFQEFVKEDLPNLQGKDCFYFVHGSDSPIDNCPFKRMQISKKRESMEILINGRVCEIVVDPILDAAENITGAVHVLSDITQRKRAENIQTVLYHITRATMISEALEELLHVIRKELGRILDTTNFIVALYEPEKDTLKKVIFIDEKDDFTEWKTENTLSGMVVKLGESVLLDKDEEAQFAEKHHLNLLGSPAECWLGVPLISGDKAIGVIVVQSYTDPKAFDQSSAELMEIIARELVLLIERKKMLEDLVLAKEKAEESDRLKTAFLNNMSHEIRTPLNGIMGFTNLLNDPETTPEERDYYSRIINQSGRQLISIIDDIINIATIEAGQEKLRETETNVNQLLKDLYLQFLNKINENQVAFNYHSQVGDKQAGIMADETKLMQVLVNLVGNAIKFTERGKIEFGCRLNGSELLFYVEDSGIGIPEEFHEIIFERFRQVDPGINRVAEGNGLGLAISKAYVGLMGGEIRVESEPGRGSKFIFTVPYKPVAGKDAEAVAPSKVEEVIMDTDKTHTILLVEDDYSSQIYIETILKSYNVKLIHLINGNHAVEECAKNPDIDLVLMDLKIPGIDGLDATRMIKQQRPGLPVIAVTAQALAGDREKALQAGCDEYITKPLKKDVLLKIIGKVLRLS